MAALTLFELVEETHEKTGFPEIEILDMIRSAWPHKTAFSETQARLMLAAVEKRQLSLQKTEIFS